MAFNRDAKNKNPDNLVVRLGRIRNVVVAEALNVPRRARGKYRVILDRSIGQLLATNVSPYLSILTGGGKVHSVSLHVMSADSDKNLCSVRCPSAKDAKEVLRRLKTLIRAYNDPDTREEYREETGWENRITWGVCS